MDEAPQFIVDLPWIYHLNSNNLVNVMFFLKKYSEAEALISQQRQFMPAYGIKRPQLEKLVFLNTHESELYLHYCLQHFPKAANVSRAIESEVKKIETKFSPVLYDLIFMMAVAELMVKNYKAASRWLNKILHSGQDINLRMEIQINTRLLYLIVLHESGDRLFENRFNSTKRFLSQQSQFKTQQKILEAIRLVYEEAAESKITKLITIIRKEQKQSAELVLNKQFDFAAWIENKF